MLPKCGTPDCRWCKDAPQAPKYDGPELGLFVLVSCLLLWMVLKTLLR